MAYLMRSGVVGTARRRTSSAQAGERPLITLPRGRDSYVVLDAHAFRNAMNVLIARAHGPFSVLVIRPAVPGGTLRLAQIVVDQLRGGSGDLAGYLESAVGVMLHGAGREGATRFRDRVRDAWQRAGGGELIVEIAEYPLEEQRTIDLLTADWSSESWMSFVVDSGSSLSD